MDLSYPAELAEAFRVEIREWLEVENLPAGWFDDGVFEMSDEERKRAFNVDWPKKLFEGRLDLRDLAEGVRRQGPHDDAGRGAGRGVRPRPRADAGRLLR
jgi:hypothetical protein